MTDPGAALEIARAEASEAATIANLMQFYIHDFSEQWAGEARGELELDGRFARYALESYWREPERIPLLFRMGGWPIGFALVNRVAPSGRPVDHNMAEFFIVRKHRRAGLGTAAARTIFERYAGVWEVAVTRRNTSAFQFWERTIREGAVMRDVEMSEGSPPRWDGPVFRFRSDAKS